MSLPPNILVQDSNGTIVRARVQTPLVSGWDPKIVLPLVFPDPDVISATVVNAGTLFAGDGSAAAPSIAFTNFPTDGLFAAGSNRIGIAISGTRTLSVGASGVLFGANSGLGNYLSMPSSGAVNLVAGGTNQNITLTPSGTGATVSTARALFGSVAMANTPGFFGIAAGSDTTPALGFGNNSFGWGFFERSTEGNFKIRRLTSGAYNDVLTFERSTGKVTVDSTTASTSTSSGALVVSGGLGVAGSVNANVLAAANGTAATPSIAFTGGADNGFFYPVAHHIGVTLNGVERWRFQNVAGSSSLQAMLGNWYIRNSGNEDVISNVSGALNFNARGTNQNITLTPSGNGITLARAGSGNNAALNAVTNDYVASTTGSGITVSFVSATGNSNARLQAWSSGGAGVRALVLNPSGGGILLGTETDAGNGRLQLATHTTSAGGIGFGTEWSLFRVGAGTLRAESSGAFPTLSVRHTGATEVYLQANTGTGNGVLNTATTNGLNIGVNGSTTITLDTTQNATFANHITIGTNGTFAWASKGGIWASSDGVFRLANNANTDFSRLQFGGTTSSFPALKRSGTAIQARLADDSGDAGLTAGSLRVNTTNGTAVDLIASATATLDFPSISAGGQQDLTITVTGASTGDVVQLGLPAAPTAGVVFNAFVSAANTVTVRATNVTGSPIDPASATYRVAVTSF